MQATISGLVVVFVFCLFLLHRFVSAHDELVEGCLFCLHFWCSRWPFRAVVLVNSAPQSGQLALVAWPDFSRWWRRRLLKVENWRPLQPCSQHWGLGLLWTTRTCPWLSCWWGAPPVCITGGIEYIIAGSWETGLLIWLASILTSVSQDCHNQLTRNARKGEHPSMEGRRSPCIVVVGKGSGNPFGWKMGAVESKRAGPFAEPEWWAR